MNNQASTATTRNGFLGNDNIVSLLPYLLPRLGAALGQIESMSDIAEQQQHIIENLENAIEEQQDRFHGELLDRFHDQQDLRELTNNRLDDNNIIVEELQAKLQAHAADIGEFKAKVFWALMFAGGLFVIIIVFQVVLCVLVLRPGKWRDAYCR